jgi:hypothetical protein
MLDITKPLARWGKDDDLPGRLDIYPEHTPT